MSETELVKPTDCTCDYPDRIFRNGSGHATGCPVHRRWRQAQFGEAADLPAWWETLKNDPR